MAPSASSQPCRKSVSALYARIMSSNQNWPNSFIVNFQRYLISQKSTHVSINSWGEQLGRSQFVWMWFATLTWLILWVQSPSIMELHLTSLGLIQMLKLSFKSTSVASTDMTEWSKATSSTTQLSAWTPWSNSIPNLKLLLPSSLNKATFVQIKMHLSANWTTCRIRWDNSLRTLTRKWRSLKKTIQCIWWRKQQGRALGYWFQPSDSLSSGNASVISLNN